MQHIHQEEPIKYHVINWRNRAFHNHGLEKRRKLLGGVYLDGGGAASGSGKGSRGSQAGVQTAQPSFPDSMGNITTVGTGTGTGGALKGIAGTSQNSNQKTNQVGKADSARKLNNIRKTDDVKPVERVHTSEAVKITDSSGIADYTKMADVIKSATDSGNAMIQQTSSSENNDEMGKISSVIIVAPTDNRKSSVLSKYLNRFRGYVKGFMQGMGQKADGRSSRSPQKQNIKGTKAVTKEEVYEIQVNTAYLLDSYNKYGERSTLGK